MRLRVLVATGAAMLTAAGSAVAASAGGNAQGVAFAHSQIGAYRKIHAETVSETGFVEMNALLGRTSVFDWQWGSGRIPHGWVRATEHAVVALKNDRVVWWLDELTPPACRVGLCVQESVEVVVSHKGGFFAFGTPARHTCFGKLRGSTPVQAGAQWNEPHGTYSAPVNHGSDVLLTYTYPWGHQTATETDRVSRATRLDLSGVIRISGGGLPAFTVHFANGHPAKAPAAPLVNLCRG